MSKAVITSDEILGKEAVDPDGSILGVVTKVHIDRKSRKVVGITIDMGFLKPDLYIGINHVRDFGKDAILLSKVPAPKFKGLKVLTAEGQVLGRVVDLVLRNSAVKEISIANRRILGKQLWVKAPHIKEVGDTIILKKGYKTKDKSKHKKSKK